MRFNVATNAQKMKGFIRFGMIIKVARVKNRNGLIKSIQEEIESRFVIVVPELQQDDVINFQILGLTIFEIDHAIKKVESLSGVKGADVFIPYSGKAHQTWMLREIDYRLNIKEVPLPGPQVLKF